MRCCACYGGEDLKTLSRALGVTAASLSGWQDAFLAAGEASLATRSTDGEALESERLKARLGEMLLERELLEAKIAALVANRPLARRVATASWSSRADGGCGPGRRDPRRPDCSALHNRPDVAQDEERR